jgi:sugar O-acyltransferase (sialic acid O-acetyltransferase NeuD family)
MHVWTEIVFYDDRWPTLASSGPWRVLGSVEQLFAAAKPHDSVFVGIGDGEMRLALLDRLTRHGLNAASIIHPRATVSADASIGTGSIVMPGAVVNIGARIGRGAIVNTGATVDHDCDISDGVHIAPGSHLSGNVAVGGLSWIGVGSCVRQGIKIGDRCLVGAGAAVVADVQTAATVIGVPARPIVKN